MPIVVIGMSTQKLDAAVTVHMKIVVDRKRIGTCTCQIQASPRVDAYSPCSPRLSHEECDTVVRVQLAVADQLAAHLMMQLHIDVVGRRLLFQSIQLDVSASRQIEVYRSGR